jgi:hypothetical protein
MVLLMVGVFAGERSAGIVSWLAIVLLIAAAAGADDRQGRRGHRLRRRLRRRRLRPLHEGARAGRLGGRAADVAVDFRAARRLDKFEYPILICSRRSA